MNADIITFILFVVLMSIFLYVKRKNLHIQKLLFPVFYLLIYRTSLGLKLMDKISHKYREWVKLFGYICSGFGFLGMAYISYGVLDIMVRFFISPTTTETGFALVLPGTSIPGVGYLSFWFWIIPIVLLAIVHEFSHGVVARAHDVKVKSSGFAFLGILAPIIPAAFVEPDEKELEKKEDIVQYSVFSAGPLSNIIFAFLLLMFLPYVADFSGNTLAPFEDQITYPVGFSVDILNESLPSGLAGMRGHVLIDSYNHEKIDNANVFIKDVSCREAGEVISFGSGGDVYSVEAIGHPDDGKRAFVGVHNIKNERRVRPEYESIKGPYYWFKDLFKWLFLLNYFIGLINLFPIYITDGARMLRVAIGKLVKNQEKAIKVWSFINMMFLFLILIGIVSTYLKKVGFF